MAQNISLMGATYSDVPAVLLPLATSGMAQFTDVTDTTAAAADVASGKYFYTADGTKTQGTASGGGGGYVANDWLDPTKPVGEVASNAVIASNQNADNILWQYFLMRRTKITKLSLPNATGIPTGFCRGCTGLTEVYAPLVSYIRDNAFYGCTSLPYAVFPSYDANASSSFYGCTNMLGADLLGGTSINTYMFRDCSKFKYLVLRKSAVCSLGNTNVFLNSCFASGKSGGTLYVPASQISAYQAASNWSTILGYPNNQIKSIESTATDPTAPVDLTTHYIDGTLIPT